MKFVKCFITILLIAALLLDENEAAAYRPQNGSPLHVRRLQHRSAMYYQPEMMYIPAMTSYTAGDTFSGYLDPVQSQPLPQEKPCHTCNEIPVQVDPEQEPVPELEPEPEPVPELQPQPLPDFEETTNVHKVEIENPPEEETAVSAVTELPTIEETITQKTKTKITPRKPSPPKEEEDDEADYEDWPYISQRGRKNPHNVFFPMMFGYPGFGRSGQNGGYPGGATAIANSFSSGKGGVATSHATAFGNAPALNKHNQWKKRLQHDD